MKRVFLIVLDSVGIGYAPDAEKFADVGANTMKRISESKYFKLKSLIKLGLSNIDGIDYLPKEPSPIASYARLSELSMGKDTTIGHWEICGIVSEKPLPTYPDGFPKEIIDEFKLRTGRGVLCNKPYSGTEVIDRYAKDFSAIAIDCIIPVPLTEKRRKARGYNQAEVMARVLSKAVEVPCDDTLVVKSVDNLEQAKLKGKEREKNILGVYEVARREDVKGKTILIVDDVMTTGSTLNEIARILKKAKAKEVYGLTFASTRYKLQGETLVLEEENYED